MKIDLDPEDMGRLEKLAQRDKKTAEELAKEILSEGLSERERIAHLPQDEDEVRRQQAALERVYQTLSKLPVAIRDGFSGRDHDDVLYGA